MKRPKLSDAQRCMLRTVDDIDAPGDGWAEVLLVWGNHRPIPDHLLSAAGDRTIAALERKGLISSEDSATLTEAGLAELQFGRTEWRDDGTVRT